MAPLTTLGHGVVLLCSAARNRDRNDPEPRAPWESRAS